MPADRWGGMDSHKIVQISWTKPSLLGKTKRLLSKEDGKYKAV